jgi:EAL domain-containing protein (putative c-di-GMP-specific phosphodiesterase class I)/CheY-like chemotaxis protein
MTFQTLRFLVVEDHDFQRRMQTDLLTKLGAQAVHAAADGRAALDIVSDPARPVDIVISDLEMPGMDGMEFIRHLGESGTHVSLILVSALERKLIASIAMMTEAYGIKLLGIVEKPLTPDKLHDLVKLHRVAPATQARGPASAPPFTVEEIAEGLRNDEFEPFFQPKVKLTTKEVHGAEALARWRHPQRGIVGPYAFISLMEQHELVDDLTWLMLRKSALMCSRWRASGLDANVSVNLSLKSLGDVSLADRVTQIVLDAKLDPRHMVLEVTESAATTHLAKALENLARLRVKGFGLSIDDYGTGYSSMQQLSRIAFTELKIDQGFVSNAAREESARVILASSLDMAKKLRISAVAEGIETQEDWDLLLQLGCDLAQGYLIARPMDAESFMKWVDDWKSRV